MLSKDYQSPKSPKGIRIEGDGGHLTTSATFTTSAKAHEANADKRATQGDYFGERVEVVTPTPKSTEVNTGRRLHAPPSSMKVCQPYGLMTDRQKALYNKSLRDNKPEVISLTDRQRRMTWRKGK